LLTVRYLTFVQLSPQLIKNAITAALIELLTPIQNAFQASSEWQKIEQQAYPPPPAPEKKKKEKKDKGSRHPGAGASAANGAATAQPDGHVEGDQAAKVSVGQSVGDAMKNLELEKKAVDGV